ncbi:MAG: phosphoribosylamine--glycine ligase [Myxococcota bacterium]|nr:phosphoribosylamine--glycine ligase [Deltaproteobacteria bacterium]MDQ3338804.1 phosphoribosylamine--glycine ligase [Myxococcota bacterium]
MRILGIGDYNELGSIYLRLQDEGHEVRVHIAEEGSHDVLGGLIAITPAWERELDWVRDDGLVLFEEVGRGALQDELRESGLRVLGGSALGDRLEQDRGFAQRVLMDMGLRTLGTNQFTSFADAIAFLEANPRRCVLKFNGSTMSSDMNYVGARPDAIDVLAVLRRHQMTWEENWDEAPSFILMDHVSGVEVGLGSFFNGEQFVGPINLDWEHKRFFPGDVGELTGEMGTVVTYRGGERLFAATLAKIEPLLREGKHVGYVNLNTIVNADGIWPLEFTCRFGYPGFAILSALFAEPAGQILQRIANGETASFATHEGFAVGVVLTVPPFPYHLGYEELSKGMPIHLPELSTEARVHLHFGEVALVDGTLVTAGQVGYVMVVTGRGPTLETAQRAVYDLVARIGIPNVRYRNDIGDALRTRGLAEMARLGWL